MKSESGIKKIGIVGGVAWPSTVVYYSELCRRGDELRSTPWPNARLADMAFEMTIESLDLNRAISYWGEDDDDASWARFDEYHRDALKRLGSLRGRGRGDGQQHAAPSLRDDCSRGSGFR